MRTKIKHLAFLALALLTVTSCSREETTEVEAVSKQAFINENLETLEELGKFFPKEDIDLVFTQGENGSEALYSLKGKTAEAVGFGIFAAKEHPGQIGANCDGSFSCGTELQKCLQAGKDGLISNGKCTGIAAHDYCVTCQTPK